MGISCGIVGLPNVGKSTLFNALLAVQQAEAANYPFCTIEPNVGKVSVPDARLDTLAQLAGSAQILPTQIEFVDIAGLVKGAAEGQGLGNQFLSHIREVDAIVYMLRCFEDGDITHVEGSIDPLRDWEIIEMELILADMESLEKRRPALEKKAKGADKDAKETLALVDEALSLINADKPARAMLEGADANKRKQVRALNLLTTKPVMVVCNVEETSAATGNAFSDAVGAACAKAGITQVVISAKIEAEVSLLPPEERTEFLQAIGLEQTGLSAIIKEAYSLLNLITFFTIGPKEARAWTVAEGSTAPQAAGAIHTDFERGFIRAETIASADYLHYKTETACKEAGKMRLEGKDYITKDGDVFHFRFNV